MEPPYFIGVDVGTKSVRAGLFCSVGVVQTEELPITILNARTDFYEQSSREIWDAVGSIVKKLSDRIPNKNEIRGIGFDATCSLVILDKEFNGVSTCPNSNDDFNIIMWMDHRAKAEVDVINKNHCRVLDYVDGKVFVEMDMPKVLWLKRNHPNGWKATKHFMELPDFLTFKSTGNLSRSICSLVAKFSYFHDGQSHGWDTDLLKSIGLEELIKDNYEKLGSTVLSPGQSCGTLTAEAAKHLGLSQCTSVGVSIIDAYAGGLALISTHSKQAEDFIGKLALICGTSICHVCANPDPNFISGTWGPFWSVMVPNMWATEAGLSAAGSLVDHIIFGHPAIKELPENCDVYKWLEDKLDKMKENRGLANVSFLTKSLHVYPDFHGNRSPLADPNMKGMISGLTLDNSVDSLALLFLATLQGLAYGTKDIIDQLVFCKQKVKTLVMCGGLSKSRLFIQIHADALGKPILIPHIKESVLLGSAMLGASASGCYGDVGNLAQVATAMGGGAKIFDSDIQMAGYHEKKFEVFKKMQADIYSYDKIMNN